jgi:hypothetical protein
MEIIHPVKLLQDMQKERVPHWMPAYCGTHCHSEKDFWRRRRKLQ